MADAPQLGPVPAKFDPGKSYRVQLSEKIEVPGLRMTRGATHLVSGDFAEANRDKIVAAREEAM